MVSQTRPYIERFRRQPTGQWLCAGVSGLDGMIELESLGARLALAAVYRRVTFEAGEGAARAEP